MVTFGDRGSGREKKVECKNKIWKNGLLYVQGRERRPESDDDKGFQGLPAQC